MNLRFDKKSTLKMVKGKVVRIHTSISTQTHTPLHWIQHKKKIVLCIKSATRRNSIIGIIKSSGRVISLQSFLYFFFTCCFSTLTKKKSSFILSPHSHTFSQNGGAQGERGDERERKLLCFRVFGFISWKKKSWKKNKKR